MATTQPKAGLVESTITTGTGSYALLGPVSPWRGFSAADDAKLWSIGVYQDGVGFEEGEYTYNHSARTLTRTTVLDNHLNTTSPVDWGAGSKEVSNVIASRRVMMTTVENKVFADQYLQAFKLILDSGFGTWLSAATNNIIRFFIASTETLKLEASKLTFTWSDSTATEGPELKLARVSSSAAINDNLAVLRMTGSDSAQNEVTAFKMRSVLTGVTPGAHASRTTFEISSSGALQPVLQLQPFNVILPGQTEFSTNSKSTYDFTTQGAMLTYHGQVIGVTEQTPAVYAYANGTDNQRLLEVGLNGTALGGLKSIAGTVSVDPFTGSHWSDWAPGAGSVSFEEYGTVVSTAEGNLGIPNEPAPLCRPACGPNDRRAYGIVAGRMLVKIGGPEERSLLVIFAVGDGFIKIQGAVSGGDFLRASTTPGVAEAVPADEPLTAGSMACIVAKATQNSADDGAIRLVSCVYMAG